MIEGRAIKISPLVCGPFNADFDGDQMAVHLPLSVEAQAEARFLMLSANNILKLADGKSVMSPTQDMIIGAYCLTIKRCEEGGKYDEQGRPDENGEVYKQLLSENEALMLVVIGKKYTVEYFDTDFEQIKQISSITENK